MTTFRHLVCCISLTALGATACAVPTDAEPSPGDETTATNEAATGAVPTIKVIVTVDWEGRELADENLAAMEKLRADYPSVRLTQFLNAAYFTKPGANADDVAAQIERAIRTNDELGLHIHGWKSLFEASRVTFRTGPTFWGGSVPEDDCDFDCGHEVAISAYTANELSKVIAFSVATLERNGFGHATSFRAGGWLAGTTVRSALTTQGFKYEHSSVPSTFLAGELAGLPLLSMVRSLWPTTTRSSQPYKLGALTEVPDNGALADYVTSSEMLTVVDAAIATAKSTGTTRVVSIGFHQETAADYLPRVRGALDGIARRARNGQVRVIWARSADL
jgi:hypothetical protein